MLQRGPSGIELGRLEGGVESGLLKMGIEGLVSVLVSEIAETLCWNFHSQFGCVSLYCSEAGRRSMVKSMTGQCRRQDNVASLKVNRIYSAL